jgi:hypothetical protein
MVESSSGAGDHPRIAHHLIHFLAHPVHLLSPVRIFIADLSAGYLILREQIMEEPSAARL